MLLEFVAKRDPVMITLRSSDSPNAEPVPNPNTESGVMAIWNKTLLRSLERKLIRRAGGSDYYLDLSPKLRQTVKSGISANGEFYLCRCLEGSSRKT